MSARFILVLLLSAFLALTVGCGEDSNPMSPNSGGQVDPDPDPEIKTPRTLQITEIVVETFGTKNGSTNWDATLSVGGRRPDIYVQLQSGSSSSAPNYVSEVKSDAFPNVPYSFIKSAAGLGLPKNFSCSSKVVLSLYDDDGILGRDFMGNVTFDVSTLYGGNNGTVLFKRVSGSQGSKFIIKGKWLY